MDSNFAQKLVDERIKILRNKKQEINNEINKLEMRDKTSLMTMRKRKSIIYEKFLSKRKIKMGKLGIREVAYNYAHAVRTNKLLANNTVNNANTVFRIVAVETTGRLHPASVKYINQLAEIAAQKRKWDVCIR